MQGFDRRAVDLGGGNWVMFGMIVAVQMATGLQVPEGTPAEEVPLGFVMLANGTTMPFYEQRALDDINTLRQQPFGGGFGG